MPQFSTLSCAKCGYALYGIAHNAACPECGTTVQRSIEEFHRQAAKLLNPIKWLKRIAGFALFRDALWLTILLIVGIHEEGFIVCAVPYTLIVELNIHIFLFFAQPKNIKSPPWHSPKRGFFWCIAAILLGALILLTSCAGLFIKSLAETLTPLLGALLIIYLTTRAAAWIFAMRFGRTESHHPEHPPGLPLWDIAIKLTLLIPLTALATFVLAALNIIDVTTALIGLVAVSLLSSIITYCAAFTLLNHRRPG